jgi:predicted nucleic acid-binding protein
VALNYLIDTSVLKRLARVEIRAVVEPLASAGQVGRPRICDLEIGYSARNADEWDQLNAALDAFVAVETTASHIQRALRVQRLRPTEPTWPKYPRVAGRRGRRSVRPGRTPL